MISQKITTLVKTHFIVGSRVSIGIRRHYILVILYFVYCSNPLLIVYGQGHYSSTIIPITVLAFWNFALLSLVRMRTKLYFELYQLKVYTISDQTVLRFLWLIELFDYSLLALLIPGLACIIELYPNILQIALYVSSVLSGYLVMSLILLKIKLLASYSRVLRGVVIGGVVLAILVLAESLQGLSSWRFERVVDFNADEGVLLATIIICLLSVLYALAVLTLSKLTK